MTPRKAGVLASRLPAGAATWVSCGYDAAWTNQEHLTALSFDALNIANWQRGGGDSASAPKPLSRPGDGVRQTSKQDALAARAKAWQERRQATYDNPEEA